ncbi:HEAT repeat-containing protein [Rivularia sp. PCC 7116]|uniref:HEAT repeat domain-containing protein n=1 Tax=Rivularia sp. PCC 7116 TaxID=373994 RepID=UPI00029F4196|nr:HEAT repeat domain-containing protein [Rivularia sp. PCC 7116]AFY52770.1 HEAT repeat-containing protein [Rivularia sp. PCC 7116]
MNNNNIKIILQTFILSLGLSLTLINKVWSQDISDTKLQEYADIYDKRERNTKIGDRLKEKTPEIFDKLLKKLQSKDAKIRVGALSLLSDFEKKSPLVVPSVIKALQDEDPTVRSIAARLLGRIETKNQSELVAQALIKALQDKNPTVRSNAADSLDDIEITNKSGVVVPALIKVLQDKNATVRSKAASALHRISILDSEASALSKQIPALIKALEDEDVQVRSYAIKTLGNLKKEAASLVPKFIQALQEDNSAIRQAAAEALGDIGDKAAVKPLIKALDDKDSMVSVFAAGALRRIGDKAAVKPLIKALNDKDSMVRWGAAVALGNLGDETAVKPLIKTLDDEDATVRRLSLIALGRLGKKAAPALPRIIEALKDNNSYVHFDAAYALKHIAEDYINQVDKLSNQELENGIINLEKLLKVFELEEIVLLGQDIKALELERETFDNNKLSIQTALRTLKKEKDSRLTSRIFEWMLKHPWFAATIIYLIFFPLLWSSLLLIRPLWLLKLNQKLEPLSNIELPEALGGSKISIPGIIFLQAFIYRPRVLDAWVANYIKVARDNFSVKETVSNRAEHISLPVVVDKKTIANFSGNDLKASFDKKLTNILIHAEGGSGKTSLACQLAKWGMSDDINIRPSKHRMLPILIEQELDVDAEGNQAFIQEICGQLQVLIGESEVIPTKLVENLLRQRRILVIIDHFSEMSFSTRKQIRPASPNFPANALIVNSRLEESLDNVPKTTLKPLRVSGNQLSSFMEAYLTQRGKRDLFDDAEYFDACRRLSLMVGKRNITALFAKLYAERMIAKVAVDSDDFVDDLPLSIPDLMLGYINELNRETAEGELDNRTLQKDAKTIAWECLKKTFRPGSTKLDDVVAVLDNQDSVNARLHHLEKRLRIIQISEPGRDKVRFALDPLAEYLAALYLVDSYGQDKDKWMEFINAAKSVPDLDAIQGFLLAVQDCCVSNPEDVSDFIVASLSELTGVVLTPSQESLITHGF